jgi:DNA-directed RNA polymerase subunit RPC12/RpoP
MNILKCLKCNNELSIEHVTVDNTVTCSFCGKKWELNSQLNQIKTAILDVQSSQIGVVSIFKKEKI